MVTKFPTVGTSLLKKEIMNWNKRYISSPWEQRYAARTREQAVDLATRLHTLAIDPGAQPGEASNAASKRDTLLQQHGISMDEITRSQSRSQTTTPNSSRPSGSGSPFDFGWTSPHRPDHDDLFGPYTGPHKYSDEDFHEMDRQKATYMGEPDPGPYDPINCNRKDFRQHRKFQERWNKYYSNSQRTLDQYSPGDPQWPQAFYEHLKRTQMPTATITADRWRQNKEKASPGSTADWDTPMDRPKKRFKNRLAHNELE
jgi:hypothetical protein